MKFLLVAGLLSGLFTGQTPQQCELGRQCSFQELQNLEGSRYESSLNAWLGDEEDACEEAFGQELERMEDEEKEARAQEINDWWRMQYGLLAQAHKLKGDLKEMELGDGKIVFALKEQGLNERDIALIMRYPDADPKEMVLDGIDQKEMAFLMEYQRGE
jgi:hypothetical protein